MNLTTEYLEEQRDVITRCEAGHKTWRKIPRVKQRHDILKAFCKGHTKILSVGSAGIEPIELNTSHALDVDSLADGLLKAKGWTGEFKVGDCCNMPYETLSFDCAVCQEVIEHLPDLEDVKATFQELKRVAFNWIITTPFTKNDEPTHKRVFNFNDFIRVTHGIKCRIEAKGGYWYVFYNRP